jgi:putative hydrolase
MNNIPFGFTPDPNNNGQPFDLSNLGAMLQQLGAAMQRAQAGGDAGAVSWSTIEEVGRNAIASSPDTSVTDGQRTACSDAMGLAQLWLNEHTTFPATATSVYTWSRAEWLHHTLAGWKPVIDPIAEALSATMTNLGTGLAVGDDVPPELKGTLEPLLAMARSMGAVTTGMQMGQGLAELSKEIMSAGEVGLPLTSDGVPALLPHLIAEFAREHELNGSEFLMYIAVREAAIQRLFHANPWLGQEVIDTVVRYAKGISIDQDRINEAMSTIDPTNPESMQELLSSGVFQPATTPAQQQALHHLEDLLGLIEGWVSSVSDAAIANKLGASAAMSEVMNRRRVTGAPAEKTFANLVGLQLRPRSARKSAQWWTAVTNHAGVDARDAIFAHPEFLPSGEDLDSPEEYMNRRTQDPRG